MAEQERRSGESIDSVLKKWKRKVKNEGILQEYKKKEYFEKPSEQKKRLSRAAKRRTYLEQKSQEL